MNNSFCLQDLDVATNLNVDWERAKQGDNKEITKIIKQNIGSIRQNAIVSHAFDEDLFQHLLMITLEYAIPNFNSSKSRFNTFLNNFLESRKNNYFDKSKRQKKFYREALSLNYEYENNSTLDVESDEYVEDSLLEEETIKNIEKVLTDEQLFIVDNYYYKDLTYREIGEKLGVTPQAIGKKMQKIRKIVEKKVLNNS